jgi:hypothetical protein
MVNVIFHGEGIEERRVWVERYGVDGVVVLGS